MKSLFLSIVILGLSFSACSTHNNNNSNNNGNDNFYDRANNASEKSLQGLDRDTK